MSNFVQLTKEQFEADALHGNWKIATVHNCKEIVYDVETSNPNVCVRIYSTVDEATLTTRDIGTDAIRVVFWDSKNDKPIGKGKRINRVEGKTTIGDRVKNRIADFMAKAGEQVVQDFSYAEAILTHSAISWNNFASSLYDQLVQRGSLSDAQLLYVIGDVNPKGKPTFEGQVLAKDPEFKSRFGNVDEKAENFEEKQEIFSSENEKLEKEILGEGCLEEIPVVQEPVTKTPAAIAVQKVEWDNQLVPTNDYVDYIYPFEFFNPVQSEVFQYRNNSNNLIIGANTSAGKTVCAELLMDNCLFRGKRIIYLSPLKALTQEKYDDWQKRFADETICILTGDYTLSDSKKQELNKASIIVMTSEMMDSRTRKMKNEGNFWLREVGLVVVDESHIISTGRGDAVECGIMRFSRINNDARILFLSATMPNVGELGEWLTVMNGKHTDVVFSTWRPVVLDIQYYEYDVVRYKSGTQQYWPTQENKMQMCTDIIMSKPNEKFLCFVHDKGTGRKIIQRLAALGEQAMFHSADLNLNDRLDIENKFASKSGLRVLVSTSTIAWGRNLPARNVVICGVHRGLNEVDSLDIIQMIGRAGRYGLDDRGFAHIVIPERTTGFWDKTITNPRPVVSYLNNKDILAFHTLAEIMNKEIYDEHSMLLWYERSLAFKQNAAFNIEDARSLIKQLTDMEMITNESGQLHITGLGRISAIMYFSPFDVYRWYTNFDKLVYDKLLNEDIALAWAVGGVPTNEMGYIPKDLEGVCGDTRSDLFNIGIRNNVGLTAITALHKAITGDTDISASLMAIQRSLVFDIQRKIHSIALIDKMYTKWDLEIWDSLATRFKYGIGQELIELVQIPGVGAARAKKLYFAGYKTRKEVAESKLSDLRKIFTPKMAQEVRTNANKGE